MPAKGNLQGWKAVFNLCYGVVVVFVFAILLAALGEVAYSWGNVVDKVGQTGAAILGGMTAIALAIILSSLLKSIKE
ncbi:MAG: hypothetical protein QXM46_02545 [Candidatus Hadarchaeales archaeon]